MESNPPPGLHSLSHPALKSPSFVPPLLPPRILGNFHLLTLTTLNKCQRVAIPYSPLCVRKHTILSPSPPHLHGNPGQIPSESAWGGTEAVYLRPVPPMSPSCTTNEPGALRSQVWRLQLGRGLRPVRLAELLGFWAQAAWFWPGCGEGAGLHWGEGQPGKDRERRRPRTGIKGRKDIHQAQAWMAPSRHRAL